MSGSTTYYARFLASSGTPITSDTGQQWFDLSGVTTNISNTTPLSESRNSLSLRLTGLDQLDSTLLADQASGAGLGQVEIASYNGSTLASDDIFGTVAVTTNAESNTATPTFAFDYAQVQQTLYTQSASGGAIQQSQNNYDFLTKMANYSAPVAAPLNNVPAASAGVVPTQYDAIFTTSGSGGSILNGGSVQSGRQSSFGLSAFSFNVQSSANLGSASGGAGAGKIMFSPLTLTFAASDQGLPTFANGASVDLDVTASAPAASDSYTVEAYHFEVAHVVSTSTQNGQETITIKFGGITDTHNPASSAPPPASASVITVPSSDQAQTTTGVTPVTPFAGVSISDANGGGTETVTVTPSSTSGGTLADPNAATDGSKSSNGTITLTGNASTVTTDLEALTFTPASGQFGKTSFTIADTNSAGLSATPGMASLTVNPPPASASVITVPSSDQTQTATGVTPVTPFAGVSIRDANTGSPTETVTVTPSSTTTGTLSDPNAATDGSKSSNGAITLTGNASTVTTDLDALKFTPAFGQFGKTTFTISDTNSAGLTASNNSTSVTVNASPTPTTAQIKQIGTDILQFYKDTAAHQSTAADTTKLAGDFTSLDISQAQLGQVLGQTLTSAMLSGSAATTLGTDIASLYYPEITADLSHGGQGLATDLTSMIGTTVGAGVDDLLRVHSGQSASQALAGSIQDFKLG